MSIWAKPGVKCVLVNNRKAEVYDDLLAVEGDICEVLEVISPHRVYVRVREVNGRWEHAEGCYAHVWRFRPLTTKTQEQDVAIFRHHLSDEPVDA